MVYVDGHVRAYQGTRSIAKTHVTRLRFPAPATVETWVSDARGDPVMVVMAEPAASLAAELRSLLPDLRTAVGDDRRVLVGFDRGGWSPTLFKDMFAAGFDSLTWRKGPIPDLPEDAFTTTTYTDEYGREHAWELADTTVNTARSSSSPSGMRTHKFAGPLTISACLPLEATRSPGANPVTPRPHSSTVPTLQ